MIIYLYIHIYVHQSTQLFKYLHICMYHIYHLSYCLLSINQSILLCIIYLHLSSLSLSFTSLPSPFIYVTLSILKLLRFPSLEFDPSWETTDLRQNVKIHDTFKQRPGHSVRKKKNKQTSSLIPSHAD